MKDVQMFQFYMKNPDAINKNQVEQQANSIINNFQCFPISSLLCAGLHKIYFLSNSVRKGAETGQFFHQQNCSDLILLKTIKYNCIEGIFVCLSLAESCKKDQPGPGKQRDNIWFGKNSENQR